MSHGGETIYFFFYQFSIGLYDFHARNEKKNQTVNNPIYVKRGRQL